MDEPRTDELREYLESIYLNNPTVNSPNKFVISFAVDDAGIVDVQMDWPADIENQEVLQNIAHLLFAINSGDMKGMTTRALQESGIQEKDLILAIGSVVDKWLQFESPHDSSPCINPRNTLK